MDLENSLQYTVREKFRLITWSMKEVGLYALLRAV